MSPSRRLLVALAALALLALVIGVMAALQLELATSLQPVWWGLLLALLATAACRWATGARCSLR